MRPIRKVLFISLSNIGDCILTLPVLDAVMHAYAGAAVTALCGPRPKALFEGNPAVHDVVVYDKHARLREKIRLAQSLYAKKYDLVVDLRNSLFGLLLPVALRAWGQPRFGRKPAHMKDRHRAVIARLGIPAGASVGRRALPVSESDTRTADALLSAAGITGASRLVIVAAGARSATKRWPQEKFAQVIDQLIEREQVRVVLIGDQDDRLIAAFLGAQCRNRIVDLTGKTTLMQTAALLKRARLVITNDSANLHLAGYFDIPVVAVFGPTDDAKYGPWSHQSAVVTREIFCRPCCKAQCRYGTLACMNMITAADVLLQARRILAGRGAAAPLRGSAGASYKRILVVRTDRMGDLVLSTPVLKELRAHYPNAYIAVLARPYTRAVVEGNPYIDEVIVYDKKECDTNAAKFFGFISRMRQRKFDLALVLHPTNRDHLITFLSGIGRRIGYDRKMGFLLTDRMPHDKQSGMKHESEYALDAVRRIGIEPSEKEFFVPVNPRAQQWLDGFLDNAGIIPSARIVVINPGASCPSKIWQPERYAEVADALAQRGYTIIVLAGPDKLDADTARKVIARMKTKAVDCIGTVPIPETAALFRRSALVISADTGPMHIAAAAGAGVIAIFGRNQPGIGPKRWGPANQNSIVLHKDVGCPQCRAHDCAKGFACLAAITVAEVLAAADRLLGGRQ